MTVEIVSGLSEKEREREEGEERRKETVRCTPLAYHSSIAKTILIMLIESVNQSEGELSRGSASSSSTSVVTNGRILLYLLIFHPATHQIDFQASIVACSTEHHTFHAAQNL